MLALCHDSLVYQTGGLKRTEEPLEVLDLDTGLLT